LVSASTVAAVEGIGSVNKLDQISYPGAGVGGNVYYDAFTGNECDVDARNREDGWGIFKITSITDNNTGSRLYYDNNPLNTVEYYGIYYGRIDNSVVCDDSGKYTVQSQRFYFAIYENVAGTFLGVDGLEQGSAGRTEFTQYKGITGGKLVVSGELNVDSVYKLTYTLNENDALVSGSFPYTSVIATDGAGYSNASGSIYGEKIASYDGLGDWVASGVGTLFIGPNTFGFASYDMTTVYVVPEPMTMGLLSLGGLAMLTRRRRR